MASPRKHLAGHDDYERGGRIRSIAIVGGGTAGWMAAAALSRFLERMDVTIRVVESERIGTISVGEATLPPIIDFIRQLGIDEDDLVERISATFKLGIAFRDWTRPGDTYFHPFGPTGSGIGAVSFPAYWLRMFLAGQAERLEDYSVQAVAAANGRFARPVHEANNPLNKITYALHFDAVLFARYLRAFAEARGVLRTEGTVERTTLRPDDGFIKGVVLENGEAIEADLFIDCSGFGGVLTEQALHTGYEDWSQWLPCDRAVVAHSADPGPPQPFTLVTARDAGWQWRIPLQHRSGNGYVYGSAFIDDDAAKRTLASGLEGRALTEPFVIRFAPGRRRMAWNKNCIALGLAAGFLEPLEATSIHLIQRGLAMLLKFFPTRAFEPADIARYNKTLEADFARVRDFLVLHYVHTDRQSAFWEHCRRIPLTESLEERIALFRGHGRILREESELFPVQSWLSIMIGQGIVPRSADPITDGLDLGKVAARLDDMRASIRTSVEAMPTHQQFIQASRVG